MNKHPSALWSRKELWKHVTPEFRLPPEMAHARVCIRILWLSTSSPMIGKGTELQFPVIPSANLCSGYSFEWKHENTSCVTNSSGAPGLSHSQTFSQTRFHVSHLIFREEKVTGVELERHWNRACAGRSKDSSPLGHGQHHWQVSAHTVCPVPKTLNTTHWKPECILGAHFRIFLAIISHKWPSL